MNSNDESGLKANDVGENVLKKAYRCPTLHVYGDVRALTNASATLNSPDGMSGAGMSMSVP
jgi:hypothetical protein